jgi:hypothetical protein
MVSLDIVKKFLIILLCSTILFSVILFTKAKSISKVYAQDLEKEYTLDDKPLEYLNYNYFLTLDIMPLDNSPVIGTFANTDPGNPGRPYTISDWKYHSTTNYSERARNLTIAAISIGVSTYIPWKSAKVITNVANLLYQANARNYYVSIKTWRKYANIKGSYKPIAAEKNEVSFYVDKDRKVKVSTQTNIEYTSWFR